jgi:glyoxylase-like metal-dependent hydrolase (beta-lactamase superfamily II)
MPEELFPHLFREKIPLPKNPLKAVNSYIIKGNGRFLIVDTALNCPECFEAMKAYLDSLDVDLDHTDFFITHYHVDHLGLVSALRGKTSKIYLALADSEKLFNPNYWRNLENTARCNGFPEADIPLAIAGHPGRHYQTQLDFNATPIVDGAILTIGEYSLRCVETPGHTQGHRCLYEPRAKILFSGDHILESISPNISLWSRTDDALGSYLKSLDKVYSYDVTMVLPGHREPFKDHRRRIDELKQHHALRNEELLLLLKSGKQSAYTAASLMTWGVSCKRWENFPLSQKWFAVGETLAHLHYLAMKGRVKKERENDNFYFYLKEE